MRITKFVWITVILFCLPWSSVPVPFLLFRSNLRIGRNNGDRWLRRLVPYLLFVVPEALQLFHLKLRIDWNNGGPSPSPATTCTILGLVAVLSVCWSSSTSISSSWGTQSIIEGGDFGLWREEILGRDSLTIINFCRQFWNNIFKTKIIFLKLYFQSYIKIKLFLKSIKNPRSGIWAAINSRWAIWPFGAILQKHRHGSI